VNALAIGTILVALIGLAKCGYGHKKFSQTDGALNEANTFVVQFDDLGQFWDRAMATRALAAIDASARQTNTIVVVYVHGWHHNAHPKDQNAKDFAKSLTLLREKLGEAPYRRSREHLTLDSNVNVIGVYIGWRGKSLPGILDYFTFWTRKAAAERVGRGDVREFLARLNHIYEDRNAPGTGTEQRPFMGLAGIGHSFGGQVLFQSVANTLEQELINATAVQGVPEGTPARTTRLSGFGDVVVLLNPALEALQYERIHSLSKNLTYARNQAPVLLVLSSATDSARRVFFPLGRHLDSLFRPSLSSAQRGLWTKALGEYEPHRTHTVDVLEPKQSQNPQFDPMWYVDKPCSIVNFDLSDVPTIAGVRLQPTGTHQQFNPFLVARADGKVVVKHSGIFEERLRGFLIDYIAITQGKRILSRRSSSAACDNAAGS
jgi:hypothetical protein